MKKPLLILFALFVCITGAIAQQHPRVEMSTSFEEPEGGWNKLLQLKNGNTFFFHFTKKEGIQISVYDKNRKVISKRLLTGREWQANRMNESVIAGMYEISGEPVIFLQQLLDRTPTLFRIRLDPNTGAVIEETKLGELDRYGAGAAYAMAFGHVDPNTFYVTKDPASDCYAVICFNGFSHETSGRIKVMHFNGQHKKINEAFYDSPGSQFKYLRFIGMAVDGDKQIYMSVYGFNTASSGGKDSRVIISKLTAGDSVFKQNMLEVTEDFKDTKAVMKYNKGTNTLELLTLTVTGGKSNPFGSSKTYYMSLFTTIDPDKLSVIDAKPLVSEKLNSYVKEHLDKDDYTGMPQNMIINADNTTTVVLEEMRNETVTRNGAVVSQKTFLGNIGMIHLDAKGQEISGLAIPKMQMAEGLISGLDLAAKGNGEWSYRGGGQHRGFGMVATNAAFMSFDYVSTDKNNYILFNDYTDNFDREDNKKRKTVEAISDANTFCYQLNDGKPEKYYLFGKPEDDDHSKFCYIESSHFLKETNTYATLMISRDRRDKVAKIAWVTME